ncbi:MAG: hypothetical protein M1828_005350 [Chrysothrix sp. TS-e1954]|nr:MAG: hypothetical protein M1828_005350 [Chrysothrix sp. TS-e1954]
MSLVDDPINSNPGALQPCGQDSFCRQPDVGKGLCDCVNGRGTFQIADGKAQTIISDANAFATSTPTPLSPPHATTGTWAPFPTNATSATKSAITPGSWVTSASKAQTPTPTTPAHNSPPVASASKAPTLTPTTPAHNSKTHTTAFKIGVSVGSGVVGIGPLALLAWRFRRTIRDFFARKINKAPLGLNQRISVNEDPRLRAAHRPPIDEETNSSFAAYQNSGGTMGSSRVSDLGGNGQTGRPVSGLPPSYRTSDHPPAQPTRAPEMRTHRSSLAPRQALGAMSWGPEPIETRHAANIDPRPGSPYA